VTGQKLISSTFTEKREPTPCITEESKMLLNVIEISDNLDLDKEGNDEIEVSLKELFPGQSKVSVLGPGREETHQT
jgi:hypothetical protein